MRRRHISDILIVKWYAEGGKAVVCGRMRGKMDRTKNLGRCVAIAALLALVFIEFAAHRSIPFMMDDLWYGTNLVSGQPLRDFGDIVESMAWHFDNWGGRVITHGMLQLTLMSGEWWADVINLAATLLLTALVCAVIGKRSLSAFLLIHTMIFAWNPNVKMSMLWQAGAANYVYSSVWILLFLLPYLKALEDPEKKAMRGVCFWILPAGLFAGCSNENMGPTCFLAAVGVMAYQIWQKEKKHLPWMGIGAGGALIGSLFVILAPGNFVRSEYVARQGLFGRMFSMLTAAADFLLPSALAAAVLLALGVSMGLPWEKKQTVLLAAAVLSYGAMVLSPHYPDRAAFGTMILCIALAAHAIFRLTEQNPKGERWLRLAAVSLWLSAVGRLLLEISYVKPV